MARRRSVNQYVVKVNAGEPVTPTSAVGNRVMLVIQNTGANPGNFRFGNPCRNDGGDFTLAAGAFSPTWDNPDTTPNESLNFTSAAGTTFAVIETVE